MRVLLMLYSHLGKPVQLKWVILAMAALSAVDAVYYPDAKQDAYLSGIGDCIGSISNIQLIPKDNEDNNSKVKNDSTTNGSGL